MIAQSQSIANDRRRSQTIAEVCFHMIADDRRTFCDLRSAIRDPRSSAIIWKPALKPWMCNYCCLEILPFSTTSTDELISLYSESALPDIDSTACDSQSLQSPIKWFSTTINGYYKNNFKIGHLNVNSILGKADEVINLLDECAFDILFITESKINGTTSSSLFAHSQYRIIRRDRKRGGGGLLVYIRSNVTAHRQINFEPEGVESICLDVKGYANNWFMICACYRSPGKCKIRILFQLVPQQLRKECTLNAKRSCLSGTLL